MPRIYQPYTRKVSRARAAREAVRLRLAVGWTQADMAAALSVSTRTVRRLEAGQVDPSGPLFRLLRHVVQAACPASR